MPFAKGHKRIEGSGAKKLDDNKVLELYALGYTDYQISMKVGRSQSVVADARRKMNLPARKKTLELVDNDIVNNFDVQKSPESLYCNTEFLSKFMGKEIK